MHSEIKKIQKNFGWFKKILVSLHPQSSRPQLLAWRDGRVVDYSSLENCRAERHRGFESLSLRQDSGTTNLRRLVVPDFFIPLFPILNCHHGAPEEEAQSREKAFYRKEIIGGGNFNIYGLSKSNIFSFFADWKSYI